MQSALRLRFNFRCFDYNTNLNVKHLSNKNSFFFFQKKIGFCPFSPLNLLGSIKRTYQWRAKKLKLFVLRILFISPWLPTR